jgi:hypothetical protein
MREQSLLRRHIDLLAVTTVLLGYFVFTTAHNCSVATARTAAIMRLHKRLQPVHVDSRHFRLMRSAKAFRLQLA